MLEQFLLGIAEFIIGGVVTAAISALVLGFMVDKFVIKKIMNNPDVKDIVALIREAKDELKDHNKENGKG